MPGAELWPERYAYYDGMYWSSPAEDQEFGFVEGYVSCLPDGRAVYPHPTQYYVDKIDEWYGSGPVDRTYEKIPVVLSKFRAQSAP